MEYKNMSLMIQTALHEEENVTRVENLDTFTENAGLKGKQHRRELGKKRRKRETNAVEEGDSFLFNVRSNTSSSGIVSLVKLWRSNAAGCND